MYLVLYLSFGSAKDIMSYQIPKLNQDHPKRQSQNKNMFSSCRHKLNGFYSLQRERNY